MTIFLTATILASAVGVFLLLRRPSVDDALRYLGDFVADHLRETVPLMNLLDVEPTEGGNVVWDVDFGEDPSGPCILPAILPFGTYSEAFSVADEELERARKRGKGALRALLARAAEDAVVKLSTELTKDSYVGHGADSLVGLFSGGGAVGTCGSYAGISRNHHQAWKCDVDALNGPPTFDHVRNAVRRAYKASGERVDVIVCDPDTHELFAQCYGSSRRYLRTISVGGREVKLDGYRALDFDGIPVVADLGCPKGLMLFLNSRHASFRYLPPVSSTGKVRRDNPLVVVKKLARTGASERFLVVLYPQLVVKRPNACAALCQLKKEAT